MLPSPAGTGAGACMSLSKAGLLFVVFVDVLGQGLIFPIIVTLLASPEAGFLPAGTSQEARQHYYGVTIGTFFLAWFLGAVYISRLSDSIGRKRGILVCLSGAMAGYVLTIMALAWGSLWLLVLGRAITGFTAGNQPIAQAAMADLSRNDAEKSRNMGYVVAAMSLGLVGGPLIGGLLSDRDLLGGLASVSLPFYAAMALVALAAGLIALFFEERSTERAPLDIKPLEVFRLMWRITEKPTVFRLSLVFFFYMTVSTAFYVFMDDYLSRQFGLGTFGTSMAMLLFGAALALSGAALVAPANARFSRAAIVCGAAVAMACAGALFAATDSIVVTFLAIVPFGMAWGIGYPTFLGIYSSSVDASEQGWVMGVSTALFTLSAGLVSLIGGSLTALDIHAPFLVVGASAVVTVVLVATLWRRPDMWRLTARQKA